MILLSQKQTLLNIESNKNNGKKIVFTNGCFDILHRGHVTYLNEAKANGDFLVIGLNTDTSVKRLKGDSRPIYNQDERKEILLALRAVDFVVFFEEDTPLNIIKQVKPDVLVKGGDYTLDTIVGKDFVESIGGKTITIPFVKGKSSTNIIDRIKELNAAL